MVKITGFLSVNCGTFFGELIPLHDSQACEGVIEKKELQTLAKGKENVSNNKS